MKRIRLGLIFLSVLLIISLVSITNDYLETKTIRDVFIAPCLVISLYLIFKTKKQ